MAMRPAAGRGAVGQPRPATPIGRQAVGVQPVYVDFKPVSEWKQEKEADIVLIYLPGFLKQNLKVSTEGQNVVRARGERLDAGNRRSRFQEDYQVPERCDIRSIRARFEAGVLTITMPWTKDRIQHQSDQLPNAEVIPPLIHQLPPKPSSSPIPDAQNQPTISPQDLNTPVPRTLSPPKQIPQEPEKIRAEKETVRPNVPTQMPLLTTAPDKIVGSKKDPDTSGERERERLTVKPPTSRINNDADMKKGESVHNIGKAPETSGPDDRKNKPIVHSENPKDEKTKMGTPAGIASLSTSSDNHGMRNYKEAVKSLAELKEERQLLVNVGAAVLVIVALGTYIITSRLGSGNEN